MTDQQSLQQEIQRTLETLQRIERTPPELFEHLKLTQVIPDSFRGNLQNTRVLSMAGYLLDLAQRLFSETDTDKMLDQILEKGLAFLPAETAAVGLLRGGVTRFRISRGDRRVPEDYELPLNKGLTNKAIRDQKSIRADNVRSERWREFYEPQDVTTVSELDVPLIFENRVVGVLNAESSKPNAFDELDQKYLEILARFAALQLHYAGVAMDRKALLEAAQKLQSATDFEQLLRDVLKSGMQLVGATDASIGLVEGSNIIFKYAIGPHSKSVERYINPIGRGLTGEAVAYKRIKRVEDVRLLENYQPQIPSTSSEMDVPIVFGDQAIGVLNFESPNTSEFTKSEEDIAVGFATIAAVAIQNLATFQRRLEAANEMALIGDVTTGLLHYVNNQVSLLRAFSYDIQKAESLQEREDLSQGIRRQCDLLLDKIANFRNQYRIDKSEGIPINLQQTIQGVLENTPKPDGFDFDLQGVPKRIEVKAHLEQLKEVISNLVQNSVVAMPEGGKIRFSAKKEDSFAVLQITDQGTGIPKELWNRVFERDYTTKRTARGAKSGGIGLWWCKLYLIRLGGRIMITDSETGRGTTFRLDIPLAEKDEV